MYLKRFLWAGILVIGAASCKRENIVKRDLLSDYEITSYREVFEVFWKGVNTNYVYWAQDPLNWDSIHTVYQPRFDSVDRLNATDGNAAQNLAFQYLVDISKNLKDGNFMLQVNGGGDYRFGDTLYKSMLSFIPKLMTNMRTTPELPDTLFDYIIHNNYLNDFDYGQYVDPSSSAVSQVITGDVTRTTKNIQYLGINSFMLQAGNNSTYSIRPMHPVLKNFFNTIKRPDCDGFIVDLRNNRGGNLEDIDFFVGQLTASPLLFGYERYKSGSGRLDYTPPLGMYVTPQTGAVDYKKKIVILTNSYTASLSEKVVMALKALPGATVVTVGEPTYGSCGLNSLNGIVTNSGTFNISSFGTVYLSTMAVEDTKHQFTMGPMIPDVPAAYDPAGISQMLKTGVDIQMEAAIRYLNQ